MGIKSIDTPTGPIGIEENWGITLADDKTIRDNAAAFLGENRAWARSHSKEIDKEPRKDKKGW